MIVLEDPGGEPIKFFHDRIDCLYFLRTKKEEWAEVLDMMHNYEVKGLHKLWLLFRHPYIKIQ